jgi:methyl-accepting chemotaxis protein
LDEISLKKKISIAFIGSLLLVGIIAIIISVYELNSLSKDNQNKFEQTVTEKRKTELTRYTFLGKKIVDNYYQESTNEAIEKMLKKETNLVLSILQKEYDTNKDKLSQTELKERLKSVISAARYGDNKYFWIHSTDGIMIKHPIEDYLNGKDMYNDPSEGRRKVFRQMDSVIKSNKEGFVKYQLTKPNKTKVETKISYVKLFEPYNWVVGTGLYVDDIKDAVMKKAFQSLIHAKYSENGYYWVINTDGILISHNKNSIVGKSFSSVTNIAQSKVDKMVNDAKSKGETFISYTWQNADTNRVSTKVSHVRYFKEWDIIIGTGTFMDDIEAEIVQMKKDSNSSIKETTLFLASVVIIIISIVIFVILFILNSVINPIMKSVLSLMKNSDIVHDSSSSMSSSASVLADSSASQSASVEQITATVEEFSSSIESNQSQLNEAHSISSQTNSIAQDGFSDIKELIHSMDEINRSSSQIANIIKTIDEIAFQTNLLALNAAVEAARAGDHGLGFAVVAEEVRALAGRSADAAGETADIIQKTLEDVKDANNISKKTNESFQEILDSAKSLDDVIQTIAVNAEQQTESITQIAQSMSTIDVSTQNMATSSQGLAHNSSTLKHLSDEMQDSVIVIDKIIHGKNSKIS